MRDKLTAAKVRAIRMLRADGVALKHIAAFFDVRVVTVHRVVTGHTWRHVS